MDYRLDLWNAIQNYEKQMSDEDALIILACNKDEGDLAIGISGDSLLMIECISNGKNLIQFQNQEQKARFDYLENILLNATLNILKNNPSHLQKFEIGIANLKPNK